MNPQDTKTTSVCSSGSYNAKLNICMSETEFKYVLKRVHSQAREKHIKSVTVL